MQILLLTHKKQTMETLSNLIKKNFKEEENYPAAFTVKQLAYASALIEHNLGIKIANEDISIGLFDSTEDDLLGITEKLGEDLMPELDKNEDYSEPRYLVISFVIKGKGNLNKVIEKWLPIINKVSYYNPEEPDLNINKEDYSNSCWHHRSMGFNSGIKTYNVTLKAGLCYCS